MENNNTQKKNKYIYNDAFDNFILRKGKGQLTPLHCYSLVMNHPTINSQVYNCFKTNRECITIIPYNNGEVLFELDPIYIKKDVTIFYITYQGSILPIYFDRIL